jgi:hypothetical protein
MDNSETKEGLETLGTSNAHILLPKDELHYFDTQSVQLLNAISPLDAWNRIMSKPMPLLNFAFAVRDGISSLFGVKRIRGFSGQNQQLVKEGDYLDFFLVEYISNQVLTLTERDRHLDVMTCVTSSDGLVSITSSVSVHNFFGHAYMLPVGIAHRFIVRKMLNQLKAEI